MITTGRIRNRFSKATWQLGVCGWLISTAAYGVSQEIRAVYVPDPANPQRNTFIDQTPQSGYCGMYPNDCRPLRGVQLPLRFASMQAIVPGAAERDGAMFRMPAEWRSLVVANVHTGEAATVEMRIGGFGSQYVLSDTASSLTGESDQSAAHWKLWSTGWVISPTPCTPGAMASHGPDFYKFFWRTPTGGTCAKHAAFTIPWMSYSYLDLAYELRMPDPLRMSAGLYVGELTYRAGPGQDIDGGDNLVPDSSEVTFRFLLDVQHMLKVDLPPGGEKISLVPQGGWLAWLQQGRKPVRLFRDQTFVLSSSSRFSMRLECEFVQARGCAIVGADPSIGAVVDVSVSLPGGLTDSAGQPVRRVRLGREASATFQPGLFVERKPGTLHFEVGENDTRLMITHAKGKPYKGNITVIWDSEAG